MENMRKQSNFRQWYAEYYAHSLHQPCSECNPLYRAGHEAMIDALSEENYGEAYDLGIELSRMCLSNEK